VLLARTDRRLQLRPRFGRGATARRLAAFGSFSLLAEGMMFVAWRMDTVVIAAIRNAAAAAPYAAAIKLRSGLQALTLPLVNQLLPMTSELAARGARAELLRRLTLATRFTVQVTLPVAAAIALFSREITRLWLGGGAPRVTASIIVVLIVCEVFGLAGSPAHSVLIGLGSIRLLAWIGAIEAVLNLAASIGLVFAYGAIGAALGTLAVSIVVWPLKLPLACRALGGSTRALLRAGVLPGVVSSLPGIALMAAAWLAMPSGPVRLAVGAIPGIAVCAALGLRQAGGRRALRLAAAVLRRPAAMEGEPGERALVAEAVP
jgi:O-antigen/teichoic acid export membrane protein